MYVELKERRWDRAGRMMEEGGITRDRVPVIGTCSSTRFRAMVSGEGSDLSLDDMMSGKTSMRTPQRRSRNEEARWARRTRSNWENIVGESVGGIRCL